MILISGAVASGKTNLAQHLAQLARARGSPAASIDMDEIVEMIAGSDWDLVTSVQRRQARELAGGVAQWLFDAGSTLVAIAGSTLSPVEWQQVMSRLDAAPAATYVLLRVSVAEAVRRSQGDLTRI